MKTVSVTGNIVTEPLPLVIGETCCRCAYIGLKEPIRSAYATYDQEKKAWNYTHCTCVCHPVLDNSTI